MNCLNLKIIFSTIGEKPYHCDICFRDFGYNHVLKLHRVQHYGSKCYKCTICDETFKNKKEMEAHIKGHANDLPDDDNADDMMLDRSPASANHQQKETKHSILLNTPSTSSSTTPSPNNLVNHPAITKYESDGSNLINFAEQFTLMNSASGPSTSITTVYPDTPKDSEASSEQNSDGDDVTYMNMYSRFEQNVVNQYGLNAGVNPALLASATLQPITPTSNATSAANSCSNNLITLKPIQQQSSYENQARNSPNAYFGGAASNIQQSNDYK